MVTCRILLALVLLQLVLYCATTKGVTVSYYLDALARTEGNGTTTSPFRSAAMAFAAVGSSLSADVSTTLYIAPGTYTLGGNYVFTTRASFRLLGTSSDSTSIICGGQTSPLFSIYNASAVEIHGVATQKCTIGISYSQNVTIQSVKLRKSNTALAPTLALQYNRQTNVVDSVFKMNKGNVVSIIHSPGMQAEMKNCQFLQNTGASNEDVLRISGTATIVNGSYQANRGFASVLRIVAGSPQITDTLFESNDVTQVVAAVYSSASVAGLTTLKHSEVRLNTVTQGGVVAVSTYDAVYLFQSSVWQNTIDLSCGAGSIYNQLGSLCGLPCLANKEMDRCNVCNGDDACLGCDNRPWGNLTCEQVTTPPLPSGATARWQGNSSVSQLIPTFADASSSPYYLQIQAERLEEITPSGTKVTSENLLAAPWLIETFFVNSTFVRQYSWYFPGTTGPQLVLQQLFSLTELVVTNGGVAFTLDPFSMKISFEMTNWQFQSSENSLALYITFLSSELWLSESSTKRRVDNVTLETIAITTENTDIRVTLQHYAVFDNLTKEINVTRVDNNNGTSQGTYRFVFPGPFIDCMYDPSFGILVSPQSEEDNSVNVGLIVGLSIGLPVACAFVVAAIVAGSTFTLVTTRRRSRQLNQRMRAATDASERDVMPIAESDTVSSNNDTSSDVKGE